MKAGSAENRLAEPQLASRGATVVPLCRTDAAIVQGLLSGDRWAANALYDRYARSIERMLRRTLGTERHADLEDLLHEVFVEALAAAPSLRDSVALLAWLQTIAARTAIRAIRRRKARSWLRFVDPVDVPDVPIQSTSLEVRRSYQRFYAVLKKLSASEQLVFSLRYVEGMEVTRVAETCGVSLSTAKRRLRKARARFHRLAEGEPELARWLNTEEGAHD